MPTTEHIHLPLYTDEETPDLSTTGHYNHAMEIIDASVGELAEDIAAETKARTDADSALDNAYKAADTALGSRIDNAETEISANSADLTGIKGLTYGEGGQVFLENDGGGYSSPALEEIRHEISDLQAEDWYHFAASPDTHTYLKEDYEKMLSSWPKCYMLLNITSQGNIIRPVFWPVRRTDTHVYLRSVVQSTYNNVTGFLLTEIRVGLNEDGSVNIASRPYFIPITTWKTLENKPFSTIGSGLKVVDNALTVDTAALTDSINANTTFSDLTSGVTA